MNNRIKMQCRAAMMMVKAKRTEAARFGTLFGCGIRIRGALNKTPKEMKRRLEGA